MVDVIANHDRDVLERGLTLEDVIFRKVDYPYTPAKINETLFEISQVENSEIRQLALAELKRRVDTVVNFVDGLSKNHYVHEFRLSDAESIEVYKLRNAYIAPKMGLISELTK